MMSSKSRWAARWAFSSGTKPAFPPAGAVLREQRRLLPFRSRARVSGRMAKSARSSGGLPLPRRSAATACAAIAPPVSSRRMTAVRSVRYFSERRMQIVFSADSNPVSSSSTFRQSLIRRSCPRKVASSRFSPESFETSARQTITYSTSPFAAKSGEVLIFTVLPERSSSFSPGALSRSVRFSRQLPGSQ